MNKSIILSIFCNIVLIISIGYLSFTHKALQITAEKQNSKSNHQKKYRIAILTPVTHPSLEKIEQGFVDTIHTHTQIACTFATYNANGNKILMRAQIEEIIQQEYDLIYTIGSHTTQLAKEITTKKKAFIPIVFGAVEKPLEQGFIKSLESSGNHITGGAAKINYKEQIDLLLTLKPNTKSVLIVYDPTQSSKLEIDKAEVEQILKENSIHVKSVEVYETSEILQKISGLLSNIDVVMVFKDNTVIPGVDRLVTLCSRYGITLLTTDLDSVEKGAALGYGVKEYEFGVTAAEKALEVLVHGKKPSDVPISISNNYKIKLNSKTMKAQGLDIDEKQLKLMKMIEVL